MNWTVGMTEAKSKLAELVGQAKYGGLKTACATLLPPTICYPMMP